MRSRYHFTLDFVEDGISHLADKVLCVFAQGFEFEFSMVIENQMNHKLVTAKSIPEVALPTSSSAQMASSLDVADTNEMSPFSQRHLYMGISHSLVFP